MKAIVNYPTDKEMIQELQNRVAEFNATLIIETIKRLEIDDLSKEKVLDGVLNKLKNDLENETIINA